jgi:hypothetical protein
MGIVLAALTGVLMHVALLEPVDTPEMLGVFVCLADNGEVVGNNTRTRAMIDVGSNKDFVYM